MMTAFRRLFLVSAAAGGGYAAWCWYQGREQLPAGDAPEWPPLDAPSPASVQGFAATPSDDATTAEPAPEPVPSDEQRTWVEPVDGECPDGYPIKANDNSGIYHVPGGRFYNRTRPERCYARAEDAESDGYRAAKA